MIIDVDSHPFAVTTTYQTNAPGCYGWATRTQRYVGWMEARVALIRPLGRGEIDRAMQEYQISKSVRHDGRVDSKWVTVARKMRKKS